MFLEMRNHLHQLWSERCERTDYVSEEVISLFTDIAGKVRNETDITQHLQMGITLRERLYLQIYPSDG